MSLSDHYTLITADSHAGGSHAQYREYLDSEFLDDFDAWRGKYRNPFRDLRDSSERVRNWDSERRWSDMESDGVVAEVLFPNTIPPFFPSFVLLRRRLATATNTGTAWRASGPTTDGWSTSSLNAPNGGPGSARSS